MNEFEKAKDNMADAADKAANAADNAGKGLVKMEQKTENTVNDYAADLKAQADEYGQKIQDAASKAKDFATEKYYQASDKLKDFQNKDPKVLMEDAKQYARQKPGQTILISAAVGLALGLLLKGRK